jgi:L-malate glycosyltransferase
VTRVALVTPYGRAIPGGISTFVVGMEKTLVARGHDVALIAGEGPGDREDHSNLGQGSEFVRRASAAIDRFRPEVVHCHSHWYALASAVRFVRRFPRTRLVFSFHTTAIPHRRLRFIHLLERTDITTFVSSSQLAELRARLRLGGDLRLLRPAVEPKIVEVLEARRWVTENDLTDARPLLMFLGPLEYPDKVAGVVELILAMRGVKMEFPRVRLAIVGDGKLRPKVERAARNMGDVVRITGFLENPHHALSNADIYCHISYQEGFPIAVLEAMSLGRCVVASRTGGIPEIIDGSNGSLADRGSSAIARKIVELANDPGLRYQMGQAAQETVLRSFTWESRLPALSSIFGAEL